MKVLLVNGSPRKNGCTNAALNEIAETLAEEGVESEIFWVGAKPVRDCIACHKCVELGKCVFDDDPANALAEKAKECDGFVFGSPVYYAHPSGQLLSVLDRAFYSGGSAFEGKPGAAVVSARRGGTAASFDVINKYFTICICRMPVVASTYWNMVYGKTPEEVAQDEEGMQTMRNLARSMAWLLKCIAAGRSQGVLLPEAGRKYRTNFIR